MELLILILILKGYAMRFLISLVLAYFTIRCGRSILSKIPTIRAVGHSNPYSDLKLSLCLAFVLLVILQLVILL